MVCVDYETQKKAINMDKIAYIVSCLISFLILLFLGELIMNKDSFLYKIGIALMGFLFASTVFYTYMEFKKRKDKRR